MTTPAVWDDAKRLFHSALAIDPSRREAYLEEACQGSAALLAEVRSLLSWADESQDFLETPIARVTDLPGSDHPDVWVGQSLGPWRIVDVIGRGGMGVVYRGERADAAFRRPVAIKLVRRGAAAGDFVERFRRERETLAALDHPNIARVLDGGATNDGQPYLVMEYVDGIRVDRFCDEHRLTLDQRLALFRTISAAVQHAHQSLVVHCDIKPDNILVTHDGVPKLLDFGIARLLSDDLPTAESTVASTTWLMTPDYASPEQVAGRAITTATDVYSLGVLLHLLLVGVSPYNLKARTLSALRDELAASKLRAPSANITDDSEESRDRALRRSSTPREVATRLHGDLDAIVLRALDHDVRVRYATAEQLADELERYRTLRPVSARGRDATYVMSKFVRRHVLALAGAVAAALLLSLGVGAVLWQAKLASDAQARAERRFEDLRRLARAFVFDIHDEIVNIPGTTKARAMMVRTASEYLGGLARESSGDLGLQRELAAAFVRVADAQGHPTSANIGDTAGARASYEKAIEIAGAILRASPNDVETERTRAMAHRKLADVLAWSGDTSAALTHAETSAKFFAAVASRSDATNEDRLQATIADLKLGDLLGNPNFPNLNRRDAANARYASSLAALRELDTHASGDQRIRRYLGLILERIGTMSEAAGQWPEAKAAYRESFTIRDALAAGSPFHTDMQRDLAIGYEKLANVQLADNDVQGAVASYRGSLGQFERLARTDPANAIAARSVAIAQENLSRALSRLPGSRANAIDAEKSAYTIHADLSAKDASNATARCDVARTAEALGDLWTIGSVPPSTDAVANACGFWRESLRTRQRLGSDSTGCATPADASRLNQKLEQCR